MLHKHDSTKFFWIVAQQFLDKLHIYCFKLYLLNGSKLLSTGPSLLSWVEPRSRIRSSWSRTCWTVWTRWWLLVAWPSHSSRSQRTWRWGIQNTPLFGNSLCCQRDGNFLMEKYIWQYMAKWESLESLWFGTFIIELATFI